MSKRQALGKGLSALLKDAETDITTKKNGVHAPTLHSVSMIELDAIEPNPFQPRNDFDPLEMEELAESIKIHGIIQPITLRKLGYDRYQIISGERRWRAARMAGLKEVPAYIRVADDQGMLEMALVENIQRDDLNPIEIALSLKRLMDECNITQEQLAQRVNKQRSTVTNFLRLLKLPAEIQKALRDEQITMGHAKVLLGIENPDKQLALFSLTIEQELSVRQLEDIIKHNKNIYPPKVTKAKKPMALEDKTIHDQIQKYFGKKSSFQRLGNGKAKLILYFDNDENLQRTLELITGK
ncbi:MAG: ParB/RepB/Spo0J family partition protein [Bacteroidia bacterium]|nr:ParB/RepB/Spo0J family partition protein [Bacteroidia bacterium]